LLLSLHALLGFTSTKMVGPDIIVGAMNPLLFCPSSVVIGGSGSVPGLVTASRCNRLIALHL
jgi:hypothetical protein